MLDEAISKEIWQFLVLCKKVLAKAYRPDGFNVGMNIGRSAGAGIEQHLHVHVIPRWNGDNNFMPVMNDTRIISQGLGDTYDLLAPIFKEVSQIC
jgi:ATP adenylyltransferase